MRSRASAEKMQVVLGQPVIIENVGGAGGTTAVGRVARAAPDGYTIDIGQWDTHVGSVVYKLNHDPEKDFAPIGLISINPQLLIGKKTLRRRLERSHGVDEGQSRQGELRQSECRGAGERHPAQQSTGTKVTFVPYRGAGPAMTDLLAGQVDLLMVQAAVALPQIRRGNRQGVANLSPKRSPASRHPYLGRERRPGLHMSGWFGFFAPKATPKDIIAKLNGAMVQTLADPAIRARFTELGLDMASREQQTPEGLAAFHKAEIEKWWPIIKAAGLTDDN